MFNLLWDLTSTICRTDERDQTKLDLIMKQLANLDQTPIYYSPYQRQQYNELTNLIGDVDTPKFMFNEYLDQMNIQLTQKDVGQHNYFVQIRNGREHHLTKHQIEKAIVAYGENLNLYRHMYNLK